ncbi:ATPase [Microcystis sp. LEGE 00066]|nr:MULTISPECIES: hypothetical protein [Microcystis]TRU03649.1 MAG: ATPase [Microcystis aeruginosa Ma_AC_P_19900807_S300]ELS46669.1 hypothetical protein C789_3557 [Microcystis aeruginosa FACHB-905 = DIANCHI905]MBE9262349.1 ATPase [Microcystis sp. LEGE 00066]UGS10965.1 ATPase [Microcystis aeruginosa FACHB-905 = DIANCHI905]WKX62098.1 ATPase [Microcystis aeruginosa PCC 7806]
MTTTTLTPAPVQAAANSPAPPEWVDWQVAHQIPGRLRIRIPRLNWDDEFARRLQRSLLRTTAISESRINAASCSLIVSYQAEVLSATALLNYLQAAILAAGREREPDLNEKVGARNQGTWPTLGLPALTLAVAIAAAPLELPFSIVGGIVLAASIPLWQRVGQALTQQGQVTIDCLDALWLSYQLLQGNNIAGALALNLAAVGESLRQSKLQQLEDELYLLFEQEDAEIHWLSDRQRFAPVPEAAREGWLDSVEKTELLQNLKPVAQGAILPTLFLSGTWAMLTGDLGRASALLPLDIGVSLRGVTPLSVVSSLTAAARQGVYIRNARVLEKLAQVDTLAFTRESFQDLITPELLVSWGIPSECIYFATDAAAVEGLQEQLLRQGKRVAWITDSGSDCLAAREDQVVISLGRGDFAAAADVILHSQDLQPLGYTFALARHTLATAYESLAIATLPNLLVVAVGAFWGLNPVAAAAINGSSAILAELNSLRSPKPNLLENGFLSQRNPFSCNKC